MIDDDYNFFLRNANMNTDSDSFSNIKDNASTYMGVKTIQEGTVADTNKRNKKEKKQKKKNKCKKKKKKRKKFSSSSESASFSSSSESDFPLQENSGNENNDFSEDEKINLNDLEEIKDETNKDSKEDKNKNGNKNTHMDNDSHKENNKNEINTEFFWDEGGNSIYLTGSFCEWKDFFLMEKNEEGIYYKNLMLPPGFHQYKFKVDNNWAYSKKQPKFEDSSGNVNNFIDTTNFKIKKEIKKSTSEKSPKKKVKMVKSQNEEKEDLNRNKSTNSIGVLNNSIYSTYIPLKNQLRLKPLAIPGLFKTHYILNERKNKNIKVRKFSQIEFVDSSDSNYFVNNNSFIGFHNLYHIHSNHFHSKETIDSKNTITSIITRYRAKYSTFIYYKDKEQKDKKDIMKHSKTVKVKKGSDDKISKMVNGHKNTIYK